MKILGITQTVASLERSKQFYGDILGFKPESFYKPTRWLSYQCQEGVFFAVGEAAVGSTDEVAFAVSDIDAFWEKVRDKVGFVDPLEKTPWGTYRFVIRDPDGHLIAFGGEEPLGNPAQISERRFRKSNTWTGLLFLSKMLTENIF